MWRELIAEAAERDDPEVGWRLFQLAQVEANAGAWDEAIRLCDEATEAAYQTGEKGLEPVCPTILAEVDAYRVTSRRRAPRSPTSSQSWSVSAISSSSIA